MRIKFLIILVLTAFTALPLSCGGFKDFPATPIEQVNFLDRAETKTENGISVTTSVLTEEESKKIFGVDLFDKGVQPVWIEITNNSDIDFVFLPYSVDPDYFAPNEVAFLYQGLFNSGKVHPQLGKRFNDYGYELSRIYPGDTKKGFLYTNFDPGIKYINVTLFSEENIETFVFYLLLSDVIEDYRKIDFNDIYPQTEFTEYEDETDFINALINLPCCVKDTDNNDIYPINFVFIGSDEDIFSALIRRGWDVTEPYSEMWRKIDVKKYFSSSLFRTSPMQNLYYFKRSQDVSLQKSRRREKGTVRQRNEMRIWLSPIKFMGKNVWAGSTTRDIGTDVNKFKDFLTKKIDPDLNETRSYLSEDMALSQNVNKIGWIKFTEPTSKENPNVNFKEQVWWSDGNLLVLLFDGNQTSLSEIDIFEWEYPYSKKSEEN